MKRFKRIWSDGKRLRSRPTVRDDCGFGVQHDAIPDLHARDRIPMFRVRSGAGDGARSREIIVAMSSLTSARFEFGKSGVTPHGEESFTDVV
jgi:hypothetical protein